MFIRAWLHNVDRPLLLSEIQSIFLRKKNVIHFEHGPCQYNPIRTKVWTETTKTFSSAQGLFRNKFYFNRFIFLALFKIAFGSWVRCPKTSATCISFIIKLTRTLTHEIKAIRQDCARWNLTKKTIFVYYQPV